MTRNKGKLRTVIVLLAAVLCMTAFSTVAYAGGGDYYDSELPPESTVRKKRNLLLPSRPRTWNRGRLLRRTGSR